MADPTLTNIQILRSPVPHKRPDPALMLDGQLAINYKQVDPGLFTKTVEGTLIKFGPVSITNDGLWPNHSTKQDENGLPGNSHGETWLDGRGAFYSPIHKIYDADKDEWITASGFTVDDRTGNMTMMKWLTVDRLYANYVDIDGPLEVNGDILPHGTNCTHNIGSAPNRWKGLYSCFMNTTGDTTIGGDTDIGGFLQVGGYLTVNEDADILGEVTIGTTPTSGNTFKVNSPSTFDSTVVIVDNTTAKGLTLSSYLTVKGDVEIGNGCGNTLLHIYSDTYFHCGVTFITQPLDLDYLNVYKELQRLGNNVLGTDCTNTLVVNASSTFHCTTEHEGELRVGRVSKADLRAYGNFRVEGEGSFVQNVLIAGKARSAHTLNSDVEDTLTTKSWVKTYLAETTATYWTRSGITVSPTNVDDHVIPNGSCDLGLEGNRWRTGYLKSLSLEAKGTSAPTDDGDPPHTLTTKGYFLSKIHDGQINFNAGNGLTQTGDNATANQSGNTTKTFSVQPGDDTIIVDVTGVRVNPKNLNANGSIQLGDGCGRSFIHLNGDTTLSCNLRPNTTGSINLGSNDLRFAGIYAFDIYTGDLHLKNERGDWTLIEEEDCLTMRNNKTGKRYAISMTPYEG